MSPTPIIQIAIKTPTVNQERKIRRDTPFPVHLRAVLCPKFKPTLVCVGGRGATFFKDGNNDQLYLFMSINEKKPYQENNTKKLLPILWLRYKLG